MEGLVETTLYIIRHGQTDANVNRMIQGQVVNEPLNRIGLAQADALARRFSDVRFDTIYCSPLQRTRDTAAALRRVHPDVPYVELPELMEMGWGVLEGEFFIGDNQAFFERLQVDWRNGLYDESVDGGESINDVLLRAKKSYSMITEQSAGKTVAVVTHGRFIRVLLSTILEGYSLQQMDEFLHKNTAVSKITVNAEGVSPAYLKCLEHLEEV